MAMTLAMAAPAETVAQQREALMGRVLEATRGAFDLFGIYLGHRLGFYRALADQGWATAAELARRTETHERYAREWLEQQAVGGIVETDEGGSAATRRFRLPAGHHEPLLDANSLNYMLPLAQLVAGAVRPLEAVVQAYRTGEGVPYEAYGNDLREGQAAINRPAFLHQLAQEWLPAMPDVDQALRRATPPARVADIGCGYGWSAIGMAKGYPNARVDGFDLDGPSIDAARRHAGQAGVADRVRFHVRDAADPALAGHYDLVTAFECVHDMSNPVGALRTMRQLAGERGAVLVVDERVNEEFAPPGNEIEWMMYGWSILHCLPVGKAEAPSAETGTVMRPETLRQYARAAGFKRVEVLPIENFFFRFYRLWP
jgi:2-polyprenyl-3-methyl-5-hydroxy-6-metoxy-1,4-benzoquinol methylase